MIDLTVIVTYAPLALSLLLQQSIDAAASRIWHLHGMDQRMADADNVDDGELHILTGPIIGKFPLQVVRYLSQQVQKVVTDSGYANVSVTIK